MRYACGMSTPRFMHGEEVLHDGRRYVVAGFRDGPYGVRLVAAGGRHADGDSDVVWADVTDLAKVEAYTRPHDDTRD